VAWSHPRRADDDVVLARGADRDHLLDELIGQLGAAVAFDCECHHLNILGPSQVVSFATPIGLRVVSNPSTASIRTLPVVRLADGTRHVHLRAGRIDRARASGYPDGSSLSTDRTSVSTTGHNATTPLPSDSARFRFRFRLTPRPSTPCVPRVSGADTGRGCAQRVWIEPGRGSEAGGVSDPRS
jgi:hypothetical protein